MIKPLLSVKDLSVGFEVDGRLQHAIESISFDLMPAETLALVGESGSGKTVTALSVMRLLCRTTARIMSGEVWFSIPDVGYKDLLKLSESEMQVVRGQHMSMVFQEPMTSLNPVKRCGHQVMETLTWHKKYTATQAKQIALSLFDEVKLPDPEMVFRAWPHQLSGGQKQRVMIAMAMACKPSLLIADEPTTALDVTVQKGILELIRNLQAKYAMSVLFISHDLSVVKQIAEKAAVMRNGNILEHNTVANIFTKPAHSYTQALIACRPSLNSKQQRLPVVSDFEASANGALQAVSTIGEPGASNDSIGGNDSNDSIDGIDHINNAIDSIGSIDSNNNTFDNTIDNAIDNIADNAIDNIADNTSDNTTPPIPEKDQKRTDRTKSLPQPVLEVKNLRMHYITKKSLWGRPLEYFKAVEDISFSVYRGETLGLVGESGCGKTTLGRSIMRLLKPNSGQVLFKGRNIAHMSNSELRRIRPKFQIIFQDPYASLTPGISVGNAIMEPMRVHKILTNKSERKNKIIWLLEKVGLESVHYDRYPHEFSGGQRQRICIARALAMSPEFIICDESVSALDVSVQAQVLNLLNDLKHEFDLTYIFISHDLSVVKYMSDRIIVMKNGRIEEINDADRLYKTPQSTYTKALIEAIPGL